jgi:hypothetical protein
MGIMMMIFPLCFPSGSRCGTLKTPEQKLQKNKRPLFDGISFAGSSIRSPPFSLLFSLRRMQRLG